MNWTKEKIYLPDALCVPGIQPVLQALTQISHEIDVIFIKIRDANNNLRIQHIIKLAEQNHIPLSMANETEPFPMDHSHHQGVLAILKNSFQHAQSEQNLWDLYQQSPPSLLLALDRITDPHNLGAISRSSLFFGCSHILLEQKYAPPIGSTVHKTSSGASLSINYFLVPNLQSILRELSNKVSIVTSSTNKAHSTPLQAWEPKNPSLLVLGSEGFGVREGISKIAAQKIHIPGTVVMDSLNVSVCAGIFLQKYYSIQR